MKLNRKNFIKLVGTSIGGYTLLPNFLYALKPEQIELSKDEILVVIQLNGGNDGLNTIVPFTDPIYIAKRPTLALKGKQLININESLAWNSACAGLANLQDMGHLTVVQNVGYPTPNRSHFRGMEIWQTASKTYEYLDTGWLGRYLDIQCNGEGVTCGINMNGSTNLAFNSENSSSITLNNLDYFEKMMRNSNLNIIEQEENPNLAFINKVVMEAQDGYKSMQSAYEKTKSIVNNYPKTELGKNLFNISRLIKGEIETRVFYTSKGSFDTHANQLVAHYNKLKEMSDAVAYFYNDLKQANLNTNTTILIFSEFGRRVRENGSGTDHGAAAPVFIIGGKNKNKIIGHNPKLDDLDSYGDIKYEHDFRSVYASILEKKLHIDPKLINITQAPIPNLF